MGGSRNIRGNNGIPLVTSSAIILGLPDDLRRVIYVRVELVNHRESSVHNELEKL